MRRDVSKYGRWRAPIRKGSSIDKRKEEHKKKQITGQDALGVAIGAIVWSAELTTESQLVRETKIFTGTHRRCAIDRR